MAGRMMDDPNVGVAYDKVLDTLARLDTARRRAENTTIGASRTSITVTEALLEQLSGSPHATPELRAFAAAVAAGDSTWDRIEVDSRPVPAEVVELRGDPLVVWPHNWPLDSDDEPYRIPWQ